MGNLNFTTLQVDGAIEQSLEPSRLVSYLPMGSPFTTASMTAGTWSKVLVLTSAKSLKNFAVVDSGGGDMRYQFQGDEAKTFTLNLVTAASSSINSTKIEFAMSKGQGTGIDDLETGTYATTLAKLTTESVPLVSIGYFVAQPDDYIAVWLKVSNTSTVTLDGLSIVVMESN